MLNDSKYNPMLINWVLEVLNWLEFKDGKPMTVPLPHFSNYNYNSSFHQNSLQEYVNPNANTFLSSLLALLIPYRHLVSDKPYANVDSNTREVTRVVVMTGNPVVAKKLIFILNAIIPIGRKIEMSPFIEACATESNYGDETNGTATAKMYKGEEEVVESAAAATGSADLVASREKSLSPIISTTANGILPIPIKVGKATFEGGSGSPISSSDNSLARSTPSIKWDIPNKSSASTPTTNKSRVESASMSIPIVSTTTTTSTAHTHASMSKPSSVSYLSSSLNSSYSSSLQSNYSLSKLGGSFMEKWKNQIGSISSHFPNASNPTTGMHTPNNINLGNANGYFDAVNSSSNNYCSESTQFGSLSKRNSMQSLRSPSPAVEIDEFNWHSSSKPININSNNNMNNNSSHPIPMTPTKLSRTQSIYDMYNMNSLMNVMDEEDLVDDTLSDHTRSNASPSNVASPTGTATPVSTPATIHKSLEIKRTKTSVFTPLINDNMIKNVDEHNQHAIRMKCQAIMNQKPRFRKIKTCLETYTRHNLVDVDKSTDAGEEEEEGIVFKHKPLLSSVAFSDEFRPEFSIQSCPVNPKLEQQVMSTMRNDLLFYQNNCKYENITTRTIFISLRAREIKLIEMNLQNTNMQSPNEAPMAGNYFENNTSMNGGGGGGSTSRRNSASTATASAAAAAAGLNKSYKTKIRKIYTPSKNLGDRDLINRIEVTLDDINQLFTIQQQLYQDKKRSNGKEFHDKLSKLVLSLLE